MQIDNSSYLTNIPYILTENKHSNSYSEGSNKILYAYKLMNILTFIIFL